MKKFIRNFALFSVISISVLIGLVYRYADGTIDSFYLRFTTPPAKSLIIGSSRPAQGIQPHHLEKGLEDIDYEGPFLNFSFTTENSPFGPYYYEAIKKKLNPKAKDGIFIIGVDPWQFSVDQGNKNDPRRFREADYAPGNMTFMSMDPNFEYLIKNFDGGFREIIRNRRDPYRRLHKNGWLQINIDTSSVDLKERMYDTAESYIQMGNDRNFSTVRLDYLDKKIELFKKHGSVFLVLMPVSEAVREAEEIFIPNFSKMMENLAGEKGVTYLDFTSYSNSYLYTDGHHLYKDDGARFSLLLAERLKSHLE
ncbi:hypothetical protein [Rhodohalobacter sp. 8-1]|uniref:hypothetical protein n=1 Tax=Rhodohalobacter sp. 8-1 TaxID=3131972 RepID=UPI0030EEB51F